MAEHQETDRGPADGQGGISRRQFIQGAVVVASVATTGASALTTAPETAVPATLVTKVLTLEERSVLTAVLNRIIPADGVMPGAGDVGVVNFIDDALVAAPHLRAPVVGLLTKLQILGGSTDVSEAALEDLLHRIEQEDSDSFDLLVQATYTGYYGHPRVLDALGWMPPEQVVSELQPFDVTLLEGVRKRGPVPTDV